MLNYKKALSKTLIFSLLTLSCTLANIDKVKADTTQKWSFSYSGSYKTFTAPYSGTYKLEVWGGQGGGFYGGKGGYSKGEVTLSQGQPLYIYVGGQGQSVKGGWNGGGNSGNYNGYSGSGGGGATDIRINGQSLSDRIIVAGAGGGGTGGDLGGEGGGMSGLNPTVRNYSYLYGGGGGSQTSGGRAGVAYNVYGTPGTVGSLGQGGNGGKSQSASYGDGGGGGYYGGGGAGGAVNGSFGGAGGSSYIDGVKNGTTIAGNATMPSPSGSTQVGQLGNGFAQVTLLSNPNVSSRTTVVIGTFNATTIDVSVPAVNSFTFNPNTNEFNVQDIQINNNTSAPVYANIKGLDVSPTSEWIPNLIAPTTYTDNGWNNLSQADTKSKIALGFSVNNSSNWLNGIQTQNIWSTDLTNSIKLGAIRTTSSVSVTPTIKVGRAITNEKTLTSNYIFEFGLE